MALCRELTKRNEEVLRMTLGEAVSYYAEIDPRGEYVLVVDGAQKTAATDGAFWADMDIPTHVAFYIAQGMSNQKSRQGSRRAEKYGLSRDGGKIKQAEQKQQPPVHGGCCLTFLTG